MTAHVVTNRVVYTLQDPWPIGVLTGHVNEAGGFVLEHVIAFKAGTFPRLIREGLTYAWQQGWAYVTFHVPSRFPKRRALIRAASRLGFTEYVATFWVLHRPTKESA